MPIGPKLREARQKGPASPALGIMIGLGKPKPPEEAPKPPAESIEEAPREDVQPELPAGPESSLDIDSIAENYGLSEEEGRSFAQDLFRAALRYFGGEE